MQKHYSMNNTTLSSLIRRSVDLLFSQASIESDPAYGIIDLGASGVADLGEQHDRYLAGEIAKESNV